MPVPRLLEMALLAGTKSVVRVLVGVLAGVLAGIKGLDLKFLGLSLAPAHEPILEHLGVAGLELGAHVVAVKLRGELRVVFLAQANLGIPGRVRKLRQSLALLPWLFIGGALSVLALVPEGLGRH